MPGVMYMYAFIASDATRGMSSLDASDARSSRSPSIHSVVSTRREVAASMTRGAKTRPASEPPASSSSWALKASALAAFRVRVRV